MDIGCGFGQDLRRMVADGAPSKNMWGTDLKANLWEMSYELFRDSGPDKFQGAFVEGDFFSEQVAKNLVEPLRGKVQVVLAYQFLHLFDKAGQHEAMKKIVTLSAPGCMVLGFQQGCLAAREVSMPWGKMFFQNEESWRTMWESVSKETGTRWDVKLARSISQKELGWEEEDYLWMYKTPGPDCRVLDFVVVRES